MRIAWFSPISSKSLSRASFFSSQVLSIASLDLEVEIFVDDFEFKNLLPTRKFKQFPIFHFLRSFIRHQAKPFDCFVYHLEDHLDCRYIYDSINRWPGFIIVHDLNFNTIELDRLSYATSPTLLNEKMDYFFGPSSVRLGDLQVRNWSIKAFDSIHQMSDLSKLKSSELIFTSSWLRERSLQLVPETENHLVNSPIWEYSSSKVEENRLKIREELNLSDNELLLCFFSQSIIHHRVMSVLETCNELKFHLIWVTEGNCNENVLIDPKFVHLKQINNSSELFKIISAADIVLAPHFDLLRSRPLSIDYALASGVPVITSNTGLMQDIPEELTFKISVGAEEKRELTEVIKLLSTDSNLRLKIGQQQKNFIANYHDPLNLTKNLNQLFKNNLFKIKKGIYEKDRNSAIVRSDLIAKVKELIPDGIDLICNGKNFQ